MSLFADVMNALKKAMSQIVTVAYRGSTDCGGGEGFGVGESKG